MITKNIAQLAQSLVDVSVTVPWADTSPLWDQTLQKLGQDLEVPGFRKGSAPAQMVEQNLGSKLQDEFLKAAMPQFLIEALKGSDIVPIDYPKYQLISFAKGSDLQYKATVTNRPKVTVGDYKTIKVTKPSPKPVTEEEIDKMINDLFTRWKARGGVQLPTSTPQGNAQGSISFQSNGPGQAPQPPVSSDQPDDNFAKAMGGQSLQELRDKMRKDLVDHASYNNELDYEEAILQQVEKITQVELPQILIEDELNRMLVSLQRRVADMGLMLDDYLRGQGKTLEQLRNEWRPQAEKNVRMELGLAEIARIENVNITDTDLQAEIDKIQDGRVKKQFEAQEPRLHLRHALRQTKTLDLLKKMVGG